MVPAFPESTQRLGLVEPNSFKTCINKLWLRVGWFGAVSGLGLHQSCSFPTTFPTKYDFTRRYDDDGTFKATPGSRRAVQVALSHLRSSPLNHQFVQMTPENLPEIVSLYVQLKGADGGMSTLNLLAGSQVDEQSIGFTYRCTMSMSVITKLYSAYIAK